MKKFLRTGDVTNAAALLAIVGLAATMGFSTSAHAQDVFPFTDTPDEQGPGGDGWEDVAVLSPLYQLQEIGTLGGLESYATSISDNGWVAGGAKIATGETRAMRMRIDGPIESLGTLPGLNHSGALSINLNGEVAGVASSFSSLYGSTSQPWVYRGGRMVDLDPFDRGVFAGANAINTAGVVTGTTSFVGAGSVEAFRSTGGGIVNLPGLVGDRCRISYGMGINETGTIVGYAASPASCGDNRAVLFRSSGGAVDLGTLGGVNGQAQAVNNFGDIVGYSELSTGQNRATLWNSSGPQNLGTLAGASFALDINDESIIVGYYLDRNNQQRACVWKGGGMYDLNTLLGTGGTGWRLLIATGVNAQGQIVGQGRNPAGRLRGFILTPPCRSDYNQDGGIDGSDVGSFLDAWSAGMSDTDLNLDGGIDGSDAAFFMDLWSRGNC